ncbi:MAG: hypothetical protein IPG57_02280 [Burkholderiales bacterium]|nr:hypothetical protein [Burkholderiales bacterium]
MSRLKGLWGPVVVASTLVLSGCLSNPVSKSEYAQYQSAPLMDAEYMPPEEELTNQRIRVVILEGEDGDTLSRVADLGTADQSHRRKGDATRCGSHRLQARAALV